MPSPCLERLGSGARSAPRLICFPFAGDIFRSGGFYRWVRHLDNISELWVARYPARAERRNCAHPETVAGLADELAEGLLQLSPRPTLFMGHSMGALVAFELARRLEGSPYAVSRMIVSAHRPPHRQDGDSAIHRESDAQLLRRLAVLGGTPAQLLDDPEIRALMLDVIRCDFKACDTYRFAAGPALSCPVKVLGGIDDPLVAPDELSQWAELTHRQCDVQIFPGGHFYLFSPQSEHLVLWTVSQELSGLRS